MNGSLRKIKMDFVGFHKDFWAGGGRSDLRQAAIPRVQKTKQREINPENSVSEAKVTVLLTGLLCSLLFLTSEVDMLSQLWPANKSRCDFCLQALLHSYLTKYIKGFFPFVVETFSLSYFVLLLWAWLMAFFNTVAPSTSAPVSLRTFFNHHVSRKTEQGPVPLCSCKGQQHAFVLLNRSHHSYEWYTGNFTPPPTVFSFPLTCLALCWWPYASAAASPFFHRTERALKCKFPMNVLKPTKSLPSYLLFSSATILFFQCHWVNKCVEVGVLFFS